MSKPTTETGTVESIVRAVHRVHPSALVTKIHGGPYQEAGIPDLLLCIHGRYIGLEVKHPRPEEYPATSRRRTTLIQRIYLRRITAAGGTAATVLTADEALRVIHRAIQ